MAALAASAALLAPTIADAAGVAGQDGGPWQRLASCQDSWLDWKDDARRMGAFADAIESRFTREPDGAAFTPKAPMQVLGLKLQQLYPQSVGMAVGFSLQVDASFVPARQALERQLGKTMSCSAGDGMMACELQLGPQKTAVLMTGNGGKAGSSLLGCYYYYAQ